MKSIVANNVSKIIKDRCLKQCAIAEKAGYSKQQFNDMLKGRKVIKDTDIFRLAVTLGVDANTLFETESSDKVDKESKPQKAG